MGTESQIGVEKTNEEQLLNRATGQKNKMVDGLVLIKASSPLEILLINSILTTKSKLVSVVSLVLEINRRLS